MLGPLTPCGLNSLVSHSSWEGGAGVNNPIVQRETLGKVGSHRK
jgi:hypothetical protein